jgi:hypothetical protein
VLRSYALICLITHGERDCTRSPFQY